MSPALVTNCFFFGSLVPALQVHCIESLSSAGNLQTCLCPVKTRGGESTRLHYLSESTVPAGQILHSVVLIQAVMSGRHCLFLCQSISTLFGLQRVDAVRGN